MKHVLWKGKGVNSSSPKVLSTELTVTFQKTSVPEALQIRLLIIVYSPVSISSGLSLYFSA